MWGKEGTGFLHLHLLPGSSRVDVSRFLTCRSLTETPIVSNSTPESFPSASQMSPFTVCSYCWLGAVCMLLVLCDTVASQAPSEENCAGSGATVRHLVSWPHEQLAAAAEHTVAVTAGSNLASNLVAVSTAPSKSYLGVFRELSSCLCPLLCRYCMT